MTTTGQRKPNLLFNIEFFTHRMEPEKSAKFASDYAERFIVTPPAEAGPEAPARLQWKVPKVVLCCLLVQKTCDLKKVQIQSKSMHMGFVDFCCGVLFLVCDVCGMMQTTVRSIRL